MKFRRIFAVVIVLALCYVAHALTSGRTNVTGIITTITATDTTGAVALTLNEGASLEIIDVQLKLDAAGGAGDFTITLDSAVGTTFDNNLRTADMTDAISLQYDLQDPLTIDGNDQVIFAYPNANNRDWGIAVQIRRL